MYFLFFFVLDPVPGGCNMEFETEIAPYLKVKEIDSMINVKMQPALMPDTYTVKSTCNIFPYTYLDYEFYHMYLPVRDFTEETYFNTIRLMISPERIKLNGIKVSFIFIFIYKLYIYLIGLMQFFILLFYFSFLILYAQLLFKEIKC